MSNFSKKNGLFGVPILSTAPNSIRKGTFCISNEFSRCLVERCFN